MVIASLSAIYGSTLLGLSTALALGVAYLTRKDRRDEVVERWVLDFRADLLRVAEAVLAYAEAAEQDLFRKFVEWGEKNDEFAGRADPSQLGQASMLVAKLKLRAALAALPNGGVSFPTCRRLASDEPGAIQHDGATKQAIAEIGEALSNIAAARANERSRRSKSPLQRARLRRVFRKKGLGDPFP